jgi:hypothetical protein
MTTKRQALASAGYRPKRGRPKLTTEPMRVVSAYVPERMAQAIPRPLGPWIRGAIALRLFRPGQPGGPT